MPILSPINIYHLAIQAGFNATQAIQATAIALAESGGNTGVVNGIGATGLFQIYDGRFPSQARIAQLQDPLTNAKEAYAKFVASSNTSCGGWWPWASYNEGPCKNNDPNRNNTWRNFLQTAQDAAGGIGGAIGGITGGGNTGGGGSGGGSGGFGGGSSGSSSGPPNVPSGSPFSTAAGTIDEKLAGPVVIVVAILLVVIGLIAWAVGSGKGGDTINVIGGAKAGAGAGGAEVAEAAAIA